LTQRPQWQAYFQGYRPTWGYANPDSCNPWLKAAGLKKGVARLVNQQLHFKGRWDFIQWICSNWIDYFAKVPPTEYFPLAEEFLATYSSSPQGPFRADLVWLTLQATRP
jgi:hypothetical protein